ncbi:hypothetical protein IQ03_04971 [Gemmobacter caeni]|uniref:Uncharacterized protein n=1 Tax=Gemmobacter caeni TaxID=589035 RepID=A0A2T6A6E0_9RHOB|nr:hypothetical protein [Gemmobacter caeni]PTX39400.1 hypothetical protein C8N34_1383 [Gemmobacter caeni]TWI90007.1 hypothetical protein IQ03_04971 [Gemmobacter caeni]
MSLSGMRDLIARMRLDTSHFSQGLRGLEVETKRTAAKMGLAFRTFALGFAGGIAGGLVTGAIDKMTTGLAQTVKGIAAVGDEAKRAGLDLRTFQEWKFVAEQNRIGVDQLVDGFKELNLRADEWIKTGAGAGAESFQRLGYTSDDLSRKLKNPSDLMLEIIGRMEGLDKAAQIRIADELFGGSAGERFVELLAQGEDGMRRTIDRANELGVVLDSQVVEKAAQMDRKFSEVGDRISAKFQQVVVNVAEAFGIIDTLENSFGSEAFAKAVLGGNSYEELRDNLRAIADNAQGFDVLRGSIAAVDAEVSGLTVEATMLVQSLQRAGEIGKAEVLSGWVEGLEASRQAMARSEITAEEFEQRVRTTRENIIALMGELAGVDEAAIQAFINGEMSAEDFQRRVEDATTATGGLISEMGGVDGVTFNAVISRLGGLGKVIEAVAGAARALRAALPGASEAAPFDDRGAAIQEARAGSYANSSPYAPKSSSKPKSAPSGFSVDMDGNGVPDVVDDARKKASGGGKSKGGGGGGAKDDFGKSLSDWRVEVEGMLAEAAALNDLQLAFDEYGIAVDVARRKAELLQEAKEAGKTITPELRAEIDKLADSYADAATQMEMAKQRHEDFKSAVEQTKSTLSGVFTGLVTGAQTFRQALGNVIAKLAEMIAMKGFEQLWSGGLGKGVGGILKALGFSRGGYTGDGGVDEAAGVVHRGEVVWSQADIRRAGGVQLVERMRVSGDLGKLFRMPGFAKGGVVGGQVSPGASSRRAFAPTEIARLVAMPDVGAVTRVSGGSAPKQGRDLVDVRIGVDPRNGNIQAFVDRRAAQVATGLDAQAQRAQVRLMPDMIRDMQRRGT